MADTSAAPSAPTAAPALVPMGDHLGQPEIPLDRPVTTVGARETCRLRLQSRTISNAHALLINSADGAATHVADLASRTGVLVNGQAVKYAQLSAGDRLQIGKFSFRYRPSPDLDAEAPPVHPPEAPPAALQRDGADASTPLVNPIALIGSRPNADIPLEDDPAVSNAHAVLFPIDGVWYIRDLASRTGTRVNGRSVHQQALRFGDRLRIGAAVFRFHPAETTGQSDSGVLDLRAPAPSLSPGRAPDMDFGLELMPSIDQPADSVTAEPMGADASGAGSVAAEPAPAESLSGESASGESLAAGSAGESGESLAAPTPAPEPPAEPRPARAPEPVKAAPPSTPAASPLQPAAIDELAEVLRQRREAAQRGQAQALHGEPLEFGDTPVGTSLLDEPPPSSLPLPLTPPAEPTTADAKPAPAEAAVEEPPLELEPLELEPVEDQAAPIQEAHAQPAEPPAQQAAPAETEAAELEVASLPAIAAEPLELAQSLQAPADAEPAAEALDAQRATIEPPAAEASAAEAPAAEAPVAEKPTFDVLSEQPATPPAPAAEEPAAAGESISAAGLAEAEESAKPPADAADMRTPDTGLEPPAGARGKRGGRKAAAKAKKPAPAKAPKPARRGGRRGKGDATGIPAPAVAESAAASPADAVEDAAASPPSTAGGATDAPAAAPADAAVESIADSTASFTADSLPASADAAESTSPPEPPPLPLQLQDVSEDEEFVAIPEPEEPTSTGADPAPPSEDALSPMHQHHRDAEPSEPIASVEPASAEDSQPGAALAGGEAPADLPPAGGSLAAPSDLGSDTAATALLGEPAIAEAATQPVLDEEPAAAPPALHEEERVEPASTAPAADEAIAAEEMAADAEPVGGEQTASAEAEAAGEAAEEPTIHAELSAADVEVPVTTTAVAAPPLEAAEPIAAAPPPPVAPAETAAPVEEVAPAEAPVEAKQPAPPRPSTSSDDLLTEDSLDSAPAKPIGKPSIFGFDFGNEAFMGGLPLPIPAAPPTAPPPAAGTESVPRPPVPPPDAAQAIAPPSAPPRSAPPPSAPPNQPPSPQAPSAPVSMSTLHTEMSVPPLTAPTAEAPPARRPLTTAFDGLTEGARMTGLVGGVSEALGGAGAPLPTRVADVFSQMAPQISDEVFGSVRGNPSDFVIPEVSRSAPTAAPPTVAHPPSIGPGGSPAARAAGPAPSQPQSDRRSSNGNGKTAAEADFPLPVPRGGAFRPAATPDPFAPAPAARRRVPVSVLLAAMVICLAGVCVAAYVFVPVRSQVTGTLPFANLSNQSEPQQRVFEEMQLSRLSSPDVRTMARDLLSAQHVPAGFLDDPSSFDKAITREGHAQFEGDKLVVSTVGGEAAETQAQVHALLLALSQKDADLADQQNRARRQVDDARQSLSDATAARDALQAQLVAERNRGEDRPDTTEIADLEAAANRAARLLAVARAARLDAAAALDDLRTASNTEPADETTDPQLIRLHWQLNDLNGQIHDLSASKPTPDAASGAGPGGSTAASVADGDQQLLQQLRARVDAVSAAIQRREAEVAADKSLTPAQRDLSHQKQAEAMSQQLADLQRQEKDAATAATAAADRLRAAYTRLDNARAATIRIEGLMSDMTAAQGQLKQKAAALADAQKQLDACITLAGEPVESSVQLADQRPIAAIIGVAVVLLIFSILILRAHRAHAASSLEPGDEELGEDRPAATRRAASPVEV